MKDINDILNKWGADTVLAIQAILVSNNNVATAALKRSIKYELGEDFVKFTMEEYGKYLETGTRPHWAPIKPFKVWASAKGLPEVVAYKVRASIAKKGTKPHPFFAITIQKEIEKLAPNLEKAFIRYMGDRIKIISE